MSSPSIKCTRQKLAATGAALVRLKGIGREQATIVEQARVVRFLRPVLAEYGEYEAVRMKIASAYGEPIKNEKGEPTGALKILTENQEIYAKEMQTLLEEEVDIEVSPLPPRLYEKVGLSNGELLSLHEAGLVHLPDQDLEECPTCKGLGAAKRAG